MSQVFQKVFGPLLSRLEHVDRQYGLGILIASCIGTRVQMGFLYRKAISGVFDHPHLGIRDVTPVAPSPTLIITPDQVPHVRKLPCAPGHFKFAKAAPPQLHWRCPPVKPTHQKDSRPTDQSPLFDLGDKVVDSPLSFKDVARTREEENLSLVLDLLQFPNAITTAFDSDSNSGSDGCGSVSSRSSYSSSHSSRATVGTIPDNDSLCTPPEPRTKPPPRPSSLPPIPAPIIATGFSQGSTPSSPALSDTSDADYPAALNPYNPNPARYADEVTSPFNNTYMIPALIGEGGFAKVMLGIPTDRAACVAIKVVNKRMAFRKAANQVRCWEMEKRFLQLAREERISHWVHMFESWHDALNVYLVMELAYGSLRDRMTGSYGDITAKLWCREMLLAVEALREHHIVHSDIKPDNFLIVSGGSVVLSDFGLAQTPEPPLPTMDAFLQWRTSSGGTPGYLSPEALSSTRPFVSHNSDIFSLGVVFAELLGRMSGLLLWDVGAVPPEHEDTPGVWLAMRKGARQRWLMDHHWLKHVDIPKKSSERDLCEKMLRRRASVDELHKHPYFDELFDEEGELLYRHSGKSQSIRRLRVEREDRDLTFEAWYRGTDPHGSYGLERPSFGPLMDGSKVVRSRWLKDNEMTKRQLQHRFRSDFNWRWTTPPRKEDST